MVQLNVGLCKLHFTCYFGTYWVSYNNRGLHISCINHRGSLLEVHNNVLFILFIGREQVPQMFPSMRGAVVEVAGIVAFPYLPLLSTYHSRILTLLFVILPSRLAWFIIFLLPSYCTIIHQLLLINVNKYTTTLVHGHAYGLHRKNTDNL